MPRAEPATYVTDLTHFDGLLDPSSTAPKPAKRLAAFLSDLVQIASRERLGAICTDVRCFKRPGRRPCPGKIVTTRGQRDAPIDWECRACGTNGVITHWQGSVADLTEFARPELEATVEQTQAREAFAGSWRISTMENCSEEEIELLGPGYFRFDGERSGDFQFIVVRGWTDCRYSTRNDLPLVEFSWQGDDADTGASGRGWATLERDGTISGRIFFHQGDDSAFTAKRFPAEPNTAS